MVVIIDSWDGRYLRHAAIAGVVLGGTQIEVPPSDMVDQGRREDVIVVDPYDMAVIRNSSVIGINHRRESRLREGKRSSVVVSTKQMIAVAKILVGARIPLVGVGVETAC